MWKHEIMGYLRGATPTHERTKEFFKQSASWVESAQVFYFGEFEKIENVYKSKVGTVFDAQFDNPYSFTLFEWSESRKENILPYQTHAPRRAVLMIGDKTQDRQFMIGFWYAKVFLQKREITKEMWTWCVSPVIAEARKGEKNVLWRSWADSTQESEIREHFDQLCEETNIDFATSRLYLDILNCQNVVTKDVIPPEKLNRKRIRNGKLPLYSYKILEVVKGKPKSKNAGSVPWGYKSPANVRFHLCRGHFKTFTQDKPLFGKYSGTFWWNPQSRGNKELGEIEKDYEVKVV